MDNSKKKLKILMLRTDWGVSEFRIKNNAYGGIGYYRIVKIAEALNKAYPYALEVTVMGSEVTELGNTPAEVYPKLFEEYDLVISKEVDGVNASNMVAVAEHYNKPYLIDLDDNFLAIRPDNPAYQVYGHGTEDRYLRMAFLSLVKGLICSTEPLAKAMKTLNGKVDVFPNCNDIEDWNHENKKKNDGIIRIGYCGGVSHNADLDLVLPSIKTILKKYPNVKFEVLGAADKKKALDMIKKLDCKEEQVQFFAGTPSWFGFPISLASMGWDIGIAPLVHDEFNVSKSHIKWMEYAMLKIPCVASKTYPYCETIQGTETIQQGKTGFLVKNSTPEYFVTYLEQLIEDEKLRQEIGNNAYDFVKDNWQYSQHIHKYKAIIDKYAI